MPRAYGALSAKASSAADRLAAQGAPSGKQGDAATTIKMRNKFAEEADQNPGMQFEEWLQQQGYGIGDNGQVYKT